MSHKSVVGALAAARQIGITTVGMSGQGGGRMRDLCDHWLGVPSTSTPRIQESHIMLGHIIFGLVEDELFGGQEGW